MRSSERDLQAQRLLRTGSRSQMGIRDTSSVYGGMPQQPQHGPQPHHYQPSSAGGVPSWQEPSHAPPPQPPPTSSTSSSRLSYSSHYHHQQQPEPSPLSAYGQPPQGIASPAPHSVHGEQMPYDHLRQVRRGPSISSLSGSTGAGHHQTAIAMGQPPSLSAASSSMSLSGGDPAGYSRPYSRSSYAAPRPMTSFESRHLDHRGSGYDDYQHQLQHRPSFSGSTTSSVYGGGRDLPPASPYEYQQQPAYHPQPPATPTQMYARSPYQSPYTSSQSQNYQSSVRGQPPQPQPPLHSSASAYAPSDRGSEYGYRRPSTSSVASHTSLAESIHRQMYISGGGGSGAASVAGSAAATPSGYGASVYQPTSSAAGGSSQYLSSARPYSSASVRRHMPSYESMNGQASAGDAREWSDYGARRETPTREHYASGIVREATAVPPTDPTAMTSAGQPSAYTRYASTASRYLPSSAASTIAGDRHDKPYTSDYPSSSAHRGSTASIASTTEAWKRPPVTARQSVLDLMGSAHASDQQQQQPSIALPGAIREHSKIVEALLRGTSRNTEHRPDEPSPRSASNPDPRDTGITPVPTAPTTTATSAGADGGKTPVPANPLSPPPTRKNTPGSSVAIALAMPSSTAGDPAAPASSSSPAAADTISPATSATSAATATPTHPAVSDHIHNRSSPVTVSISPSAAADGPAARVSPLSRASSAMPYTSESESPRMSVSMAATCLSCATSQTTLRECYLTGRSLGCSPTSARHSSTRSTCRSAASQACRPRHDRHTS
ncbi:hypothetical protein BC831DRAFT_457247, partial [Entophlyctis helioformis]